MADPVGFRPPKSEDYCHTPKTTNNDEFKPKIRTIYPLKTTKRYNPISLPPESSPHYPFRPIDPSCDAVKKTYYWVDTFALGGVPSTALPGGEDIDGHQIYVGRAYFKQDWIPAKVIPGRNKAYVAYDGKEHAVEKFQVLCEQRFDWVNSHGGDIPEGAVEGGRTVDGEPLYIGRVHHENSHTVGKVHPSYKQCFIPFDGKEIGFPDYEILVLRS